MKILIYSSVFLFSTIGSVVPGIFHQGMFSAAGIIGGIVGTVFGIWVAIKVNSYI